MIQAKNIAAPSGPFNEKDFNAKITEIESEIPASISGLATNFVLTAVESKIPDNSCRIKKQNR